MADQSLLALADRLENSSPNLSKSSVVVGFDGFIDEIISVVDERRNLKEWKRVEDIKAFRDLVGKSAGHSSLREIVIQRQDAGGCAINLGDGLASLGVGVECFATIGTPRHPAFEPIVKKFRSYHAWGKEYGRTLAFEFSDGKLMFSAVSQLSEFNEKMLESELLDSAYANACNKAKIIALTDWTLYPHMTSCWLKLQHDVYSKLTHLPHFFFDLVDPGGRTKEDIKEMLTVLSGFEKFGKVVLGLNGNEANILSEILQLPAKESGKTEKVVFQAMKLREKLNISCVTIHHREFAVSADINEAQSVEGPYCPSPKKSTGAGDRFNAGFCMGMLLSCDMKSCLQLASASSGYYVRAGRSAELHKLVDFIRNWSQGTDLI